MAVRNKVLFIGPLGQPATGQSIAADAWIRGTVNEVLIVNTNAQNLAIFSKLKLLFFNFMKTMAITLRNRNLTLYVSIKRSPMGSTTDCFLVLLHYFFCIGNRVAHIHGADYQNVDSSTKNLLMFKLIFSIFNRVIVLSETMSIPFKRYTSCEVEIVNNFSGKFIGSDHLNVKVLGLKSREVFDVLYLSNVMFSKGIIELVSAIRMLNQTEKVYQLHVAGDFISDDFRTQEEMQYFIHQELRKDSLKYYGVVEQHKKWQLLRDVNILALPTFYKTEAQPLSLIEGLSFGNSIVTTRHNFNEEFLRGFDVEFCEVRNVKSVANALSFARAKLLGNHDWIYSNHSLAKLKFSEKIYAQHIDIILDQKSIKNG